MVSAQQGYYLAQYYLGEMYQYGEGINQDLKEAFKWYKLAGKQNYRLAQWNTGRYYYNELQNYQRANKWFGLCYNYYKSQFYLGLLYFNGYHVPQDYNVAIKLFILSANKGYLYAQYKLGHIYRYGIGVKCDLDEAIKWYTLSADQQHAGSLIALARIYKDKQDYGLALKYLNMCDDSEAQFLLGTFYHQGLGVEPNLERACDYYKLAVKDDSFCAQRIFNIFYRAKQFDIANEILNSMGIPKIPDIISKFIQHIVTYVWNSLANNQLVTGLPLNRSAPIITFSNTLMDDASGVYHRSMHRIFINKSYFDIDILEQEILNYIHDIQSLSNTSEVKRLIGVMPKASIVIHELGHSFREVEHNDTDGHGIYKFRYDNVDYSLTYDEGCNFLWNIGIRGYVPSID